MPQGATRKNYHGSWQLSRPRWRNVDLVSWLCCSYMLWLYDTDIYIYMYCIYDTYIYIYISTYIYIYISTCIYTYIYVLYIWYIYIYIISYYMAMVVWLMCSTSFTRSFQLKNRRRTTLTPTQTKHCWMIVPVGNRLAIDNSSIRHKGFRPTMGMTWDDWVKNMIHYDPLWSTAEV